MEGCLRSNASRKRVLLIRYSQDKVPFPQKVTPQRAYQERDFIRPYKRMAGDHTNSDFKLSDPVTSSLCPPVLYLVDPLRWRQLLLTSSGQST
jgi:hypothetical protein